MSASNDYQQYRNEYIIRPFSNLIDQDIYSTLFDTDGKVIACTTKNAVESGFSSWQEMVGLSYTEVTTDIIINLMGEVAKDNADAILAACRKIHELLLIVVSHKRVINFIDLIPYNGHYRSFLETQIPIFHPSGEVVAVQSMSAEFKMFDPHALILRQCEEAKPFAIPHNEPPIILPKRQHEILYLILQGVPQEYAAQMLNIKRGTLARIVSEGLCPKFGINGSNTKLLVERALEMGFQNHMPKSLWKPGIVILDDQIAQLVNQRINKKDI